MKEPIMNPYGVDCPYKLHIKSSNELITTYEETRAGFVAQALEKTRIAVPFVEEARSLKAIAKQAKNPKELLNIPQIRPALETAAGISNKSNKYIDPKSKDIAIENLIKTYLDPAGANFVEELIFRFLLVKGDSLGGSIRNMISKWAERKLSRAIISFLNNADIEYYWLQRDESKWIKKPSDDTDIEGMIKGISWSNGKENRTIIYNLTVPFLQKGNGKNVDICVFRCSYKEYIDKGKKDKLTKNKPELYLALGELKGGIDPAGSDEHWKTARSALNRIRDSFQDKNLSPNVFFVGAAIEKSVSDEIWSDLENHRIQNAANLTKSDQVASLCNWLCNI